MRLVGGTTFNAGAGLRSFLTDWDFGKAPLAFFVAPWQGRCFQDLLNVIDILDHKVGSCDVLVRIASV